MNDTHAILINLISSLLWIPIGALLFGIGYFIRVRLPKRRLWRLTDPTSLIVCTANSTITDTGAYLRPATGIGQVRALAIAMRSLSKAYTRQLDIKNIHLSTDSLQEHLENDLLLLGGPKNNQVTARFLDLIGDKQPIVQISTPENKIIWRVKQQAGKWIDDDALEYMSKIVDKQVIQDYGVILRMNSPFTSRVRTVILLSGNHTYGTIAAARYFTENMPRGFRWVTTLGKPNIVAIVSTHLFDGYPTKITLERLYTW